MLHPLFSTVVQRPDLVMDHVSAYAALFHQEASKAGSELVERGVAWGIAAVCAIVFLGLGGTAVMLGVMENRFNWVLVIVPGVALVLMVLAVLKAKKPLTSERFPELRAQIDSDTSALRAAA
jgi:peptidoglycan/LPS O-acetylase OafA/YrhL